MNNVTAASIGTPSYVGLGTVGLDWSMNPLQLGKVTLAWQDAAAGEAGFKIERSLDGTNWVEVGSTPANVATFVDSSLPPSGTFSYRVRSFDGSGNTSAYSNTASGSPK